MRRFLVRSEFGREIQGMRTRSEGTDLLTMTQISLSNLYDKLLSEAQPITTNLPYGGETLRPMTSTFDKGAANIPKSYQTKCDKANQSKD